MMMNCIESLTAQQLKSRLNESGDSEYLIKQEKKEKWEILVHICRPAGSDGLPIIILQRESIVVGKR